MTERNHKVHHYAQYSEGPAPEVPCKPTELAFNHVQLGEKQVPHDPYPWLASDDPRRNMTDREILEKYVGLSDSDLTKKEKEQLYKVLLKYKTAFSLRDEIGLCPNMEVELELNDTTHFFIGPFPIK